MEIINSLLKAWPVIVGAIAFFSALYWNQRGIIVMLRHQQSDIDDLKSDNVQTKIDIATIKSDHNGALTQIDQKVANLQQVMEVELRGIRDGINILNERHKEG